MCELQAPCFDEITRQERPFQALAVQRAWRTLSTIPSDGGRNGPEAQFYKFRRLELGALVSTRRDKGPRNARTVVQVAEAQLLFRRPQKVDWIPWNTREVLKREE